MSDPRVAVVLASAGRPALLRAAMADVEEQTGIEPIRVLSVPDHASLPERHLGGWRVVVGTRGLAAQRNAGLAELTDVELVFFFDDDAVLRPDYLRNAVDFFAAHPEIVGLTGRVLLDGASSAEIPVPVAYEALTDSLDRPLTGAWRPSRELYGCNFGYRTSAAPGQPFDARLPLYSWLEDHDLARRLLKVGPLASVDDCVIVHRGAASGGRTAHTRLGYSQVMNPIYLWRKRSFPAWLAAWEIFRPVAKSLAYAVAGSQAGWRRERLRGNSLAARDALRGRITPERILQL